MVNKNPRSILKTDSIHVFFGNQDLITELLIRLTLKTLFRSKCVCKTWQRLISNPSFIKNFIRRSKSRPPPILGFLYSNFEDKVHFFDFESSNIKSNVDLDTNLSFLQPNVITIASYNGLFLYAEKLSSFPDYSVSNPLVRGVEHLPFPSCRHEPEITLFYCKLSGEDSEYEFQVVCFEKFCAFEVSLEVFFSEVGRWQGYNIDCGYCFKMPGVLFDGFLYLCSVENRVLAVCDLREGSLDLIELPKCSDYMFNGLLGVSDESVVYYLQSDRTFFQVWVLVDGVEWSLKNSIRHETWEDEFDVIPLFETLFWPLAFHPLDHGLVLLTLSHLEFFLYHINTGKLEELHNFHPKFETQVFPYSMPSWLPFITLDSDISDEEVVGHRSENDDGVEGVSTDHDIGENHCED